MRTFKQYITEAKNTHMTHIEDLVLDGGVNGTRDAINALRALRDMLAGTSTGSHSLTVKWDGAPAVFAGIDPTDGEFFVAKKGIFNKNPKVYKSFDDIDADTSGDLSDKLKIAYTELKKLGIKGVIQGDIMFTKPDLKSETIDGQKYITFHPNTIVYAIPKDQASDVLNAKIGVVWHTSYTGDTFESMKASFGVKVDTLKKVKSVWSKSADLPDLTGVVTLSKKDTATVTQFLSNAGSIFRQISGSILKDVADNKEINMAINTFNNTKVRQAEKIINADQHVSELMSWIQNRYQKDIDKLKSVKGKERKTKKLEDVMKFFSASNKKGLVLMFDLQNELVAAKEMLITQLSQVQNTKTFVKTSKGFKVTGAEGYVAIDNLTGGAVKLVDRMEFSANNFSADIIKGWQK
jgi:hypothetical protein